MHKMYNIPKTKQKICVDCGKPFTPLSRTMIRCDACAKKLGQDVRSRYFAGEHYVPTKPHTHLGLVLEQARAAGLSYGQYVAQRKLGAI